ncbi:DNA-binding transcriptional regulator, MarR family [Kaistia soli DSM 19436]|uniref:DNA-binding transcriptional regulator, MarR family n=1 Tax=Kaistia soli DSM 19436 TaxID=1122133 RepID=A0A1M5DHL5_9HYPH|nr:helix-turn-helix domain-containing GNAT family N-acetyltransferase [Kaistia soli]SHF66371.1 DNA-binding transcriptional regulator, MarR family [Kaistia soli DSM 19436]
MPVSQIAVDHIRAASRQLVRELGFMGGPFAGTDLPPSAVHALIEIDARDGISARELGGLLRLEKSSISRMLRKLVISGDIEETPDEGDARSKKLTLSAAGRARVAEIHAFARKQVASALERLPSKHHPTVLNGLSLYADALAAAPVTPRAAAATEIVAGYRPGLVARITEMHALYYARTAGFGRRFESMVAGGLAAFCDQLDAPGNDVWAAIQDDRMIGSIAIEADVAEPSVAHLRWFIVDDTVRGGGVGRRLLATALGFADVHDFAETNLWTFGGLHAARHLYEQNGFVLAEERRGSRWGSEVLEQRFVRVRP